MYAKHQGDPWSVSEMGALGTDEMSAAIVVSSYWCLSSYIHINTNLVTSTS